MRVVSLLFAVTLLSVVAWNVPWHDTLQLDQATWSGEIEGDWKGEEIHFVFDPDQEAVGTPLAGTDAETAPARGLRVRVTRTGLEVPAAASEGAQGANAAPEIVPGEFSWRPGMPRAFSDLEVLGVVPAIGFLVLATLFAITRWWRLLALIGCPTSWMTALRVTYVGLFFNLIVPGMSGGDVARAIIVVREHPDRRADALMSVVVDRVLGLIAILTLATTAVYLSDANLSELRLPVTAALAVLVLGSIAYVNPTLRRWLRFDRLVERLPQARRIKLLDQALAVYVRHPGEIVLALLLSFANHLSVTASILWIGHAFGDELSYGAYLAAVSITNTLTSLPISPGGWGVGEAAFGYFFVLLGAQYTLGVATSITYRLCLIVIGLAGGVIMLLPGGRSVRRQFAQSVGEPGVLDDPVLEDEADSNRVEPSRTLSGD